jgi:addiction module RelB/DinJ family antitoxin
MLAQSEQGERSDARVTIRVDRDLKDRADALFGRLGLNMTAALTVFLRKAVDEGGIPFAVSARGADGANGANDAKGAKGATFGAGLTASDITEAFGAAVRDEVAARLSEGHPVVRYDDESGRAYLEGGEGLGARG